jgi:hypothetical protein
MKSILKAFSAVALTGVMVLPVLADDATTTTDGKDQKDLKKVIEDQGINYVETAQKGITLSGYVDTSYTQQFAGKTTPFLQPNGAGISTANLRQFDNNANSFNVNAVKIALEKALPDKNEWAAGFRIDTIYGADAKFLGDSAFLNGVASNNLAIEQALVKFRIPVGNGLDIYAGKFVTFLGYEVIESPANPNFSRGLLFTNAIPLTHTGVYADYKFNDTFEAKFGVVDGWNNSTSTPNGSDNTFGGKAITGQLNIEAPGKNANITQSFIYSPQNDPAALVGPGTPALGAGSTGTGSNPVFVYDIWGNWTPTFDKNGNTTLGFNIDYGYDGYSWYGAALYAQYKLTKTITLAGRGEYLHSDANANKFGTGLELGPGGTVHATAQDDFSLTATISFAVWDNLLTRAEYRIDDLSAGSTGTGTSSVQNEISLEAVYSF